MCLSIILTRPLSPNARYMYVCVCACLCVFHPHLVISLLIKKKKKKTVSPSSPSPCHQIMFFFPAPSDPVNFPVWYLLYFNLFLLLAPSLAFLPHFFLPMATSHATFTPSSLLLSRSLLHLLAFLFFTSFQRVFLESPLSLPFPIRALILLCFPHSFSPLPVSSILLILLPSHVFVLGRCLLMEKGVNTYTICCAPETWMTQENPSWLDVRAAHGRPLCYNYPLLTTPLVNH